MTKTKRIICPFCKAAHLPGGNYTFNEELSLICGKCKKTIFPTTEKEEIGIPKLADRRYVANRGHQTQWQIPSDADVVFA